MCLFLGILSFRDFETTNERSWGNQKCVLEGRVGVWEDSVAFPCAGVLMEDWMWLLSPEKEGAPDGAFGGPSSAVST